MNRRLSQMKFMSALAAAVILASSAAMAAPPPDALPLSQIIREIEARADFAHFDDIEWDDDGYWEVEYVTKSGSEVEIKIDPRSGQQRR
jgi:uncharacterized membrane protein YkoI